MIRQVHRLVSCYAGKGMFASYDSSPPKTTDFSAFMKQAEISVDLAKTTLQQAEKAVKRAECFFTDCQCFIK